MDEQNTDIQSKLSAEIDRVPEEFLPALLNIVHSFRESVALNDAEDSFEQGWKETLQGDYKSADDLWEGIDH